MRLCQFLTLFVLCLGFTIPVVAQDIDALSKGNVRAFIERSAAVSSGDFDGLSKSDVRAYLDRHIEDDARFKSAITYHIPDMPARDNAFQLGKSEYIDSLFEVADRVDSYAHELEILNIKLLSRGKKAFVQTRTTEYANMPVPTEGGGAEDVPVEGISECTQVLSLNRGVIQIYSAHCKSDLHFKRY